MEQTLEDLKKDTSGALQTHRTETDEIRSQLRLSEAKVMGALMQTNNSIAVSGERTMNALGGVQAKLDMLESNSRQTRMDVNMLQAKAQPAQPLSVTESLDETDWYCSPAQAHRRMNHDVTNGGPNDTTNGVFNDVSNDVSNDLNDSTNDVSYVNDLSHDASLDVSRDSSVSPGSSRRKRMEGKPYPYPFPTMRFNEPEVT